MWIRFVSKIGRAVRVAFELFRDAFKTWRDDRAPRLGAALAYYTIFSIAPLLLIAIVIAGLVFGQAAAEGAIVELLQEQVGVEAAQAIQSMIRSISDPRASLLATAIAIVAMLIGATNFFYQLKDALNTIWGVAPKPEMGLKVLLIDRLLALAMVGFIGLILLASLFASTLVAALSHAVAGALPSIGPLWQWINAAISFGVITLLFAMIFRILPDVKIAWSDVWIGAAVTSLLFTIGASLLGLYLGRSSISSVFGAAGSLVVLLVWIYYSAQILLFGAEFTQVYAYRYGSRMLPIKRARWVDPPEAESRSQPGEVAPRPEPAPQVAGSKRQSILAALFGVAGGALMGVAAMLIGSRARRRDG
jgi:membrane protein